ncbi:MFS general substrate transporter [Xylariomycetidae sp. FL2044]|nr:MFS general substrate transporter [Xylariomycetidae sp. FL2044]
MASQKSCDITINQEVVAIQDENEHRTSRTPAGHDAPDTEKDPAAEPTPPPPPPLNHHHHHLQLPTEKHPHNWPAWRKWLCVTIVAYLDGLTFLTSMMLAPALPSVLSTFLPPPSGGGNQDPRPRPQGTLSITIYILGFVVGPLALAPLTDLRGRLPVYRATALAYLGATVACALAPSLTSLIAFRFLAGCAGGAPMAIGGAVVADLFPKDEDENDDDDDERERERATATATEGRRKGRRKGPMAVYGAGTVMGPTLGPVLGGLVTGAWGWRWVFWVAGILAGIAFLSVVFALPETHLPTLARRHREVTRSEGVKKKKKRTATLPTLCLPRLHPPTDDNDDKTPSITATLRQASTLPARIALTHRPSTTAILLLMLVFNGLVNVILSSLGTVYQQAYALPVTTAGLAYLGIGVGGAAGLFGAKRATLWVADRLRRGEEKGEEEEEHALLPFLGIALVLGGLGLVWYGWALQAREHWIVPVLGLVFFGAGYMSVRLTTQLFLIEAVPEFPASALAAHTVASSIGGAVIPLATFPLYGRVGYGWGNTVVAAVMVSLSAVPAWLYVAAAARRRRRRRRREGGGSRGQFGYD